jgi:hypothetical protein
MCFKYETHSTTNINSTPVCVLEVKERIILDSLFLTNTGSSSLRLTIRMALLRQDEKKESCFAKGFKLDQGFPKEFMDNGCLYLFKGDEILVNSDHSENFLDCHISWRAFLEDESL